MSLHGISDAERLEELKVRADSAAIELELALERAIAAGQDLDIARAVFATRNAEYQDLLQAMSGMAGRA